MKAVRRAVVCLFVWCAAAGAQSIQFFGGPDLNQELCGGPPTEDCFVSDPLYLSGINNKRELTGYWFTEGAIRVPPESVVFDSSGAMQTIPMPRHNERKYPWSFINATRINDSGTVIGGFTLLKNPFDPESEGFPFIGDLEGTRVFSIPRAVDTFVSGLNNLDQIVGTYYVRTAEGGIRPKQFILTGKKIQSLTLATDFAVVTDLNDSGDLVGRFASDDGGTSLISGFVQRSNGAFTRFDVPGAAYTVPQGINNKGDVVGYYYKPDGDPEWWAHGFIYSNGVLTLDPIGGIQVYFGDINDFGDVVGHAENVPGMREAIGLNVGSFIYSLAATP